MPIVAERSGREVEIGQINLFIANDLPRSRAVGFGRHHDPFGGYRSVWRLHDPLSTVAFGGYHGAIRIQPCARLLRGGGETANIGERLNCACTRIQKCAGIGCRASASGRFLCIENTNGRAPFGPLFAAFADFTEPFFTNCAMQRSVFRSRRELRVFPPGLAREVAHCPEGREAARRKFRPARQAIPSA